MLEMLFPVYTIEDEQHQTVDIPHTLGPIASFIDDSNRFMLLNFISGLRMIRW